AEIDQLLMQFRLRDKTRLSDGEFSTIDLSGGQRRRLSLIVSLLEKRQILLLDEWTAEQDPEFLRKCYEELLPSLMRDVATVAGGVDAWRGNRGGDNSRRPLPQGAGSAGSEASDGRRSFRGRRRLAESER